MAEIIVEVTIASAKDGKLLSKKFPMDEGLYNAIQSLQKEEDRIKYFTMEYRDWKREDNRICNHFGGSLDSEDSLIERAHEVPDESLNPAEYCLKKEKYALLREALSKLTFRQRMVVEAIYYEEKSQKEVADQLGMTEQAMSMYVAYVLAKLRKFLEGKI